MLSDERINECIQDGIIKYYPRMSATEFASTIAKILIAEAIAAERERCAGVCWELGVKMNKDSRDADNYHDIRRFANMAEGAGECEQAIRAEGKSEG